MFVLRCFLFISINFATTMLYAQNMDDFKWKNRILIFTDSDQKLSNAKAALAPFEALDKEVKERSLLLFIYSKGFFYDKNGKPYKLAYKNHIPSSFKGILLLGKDGGIKFQEPYPVKTATIFDLIDSMPMRRAEMKN